MYIDILVYINEIIQSLNPFGSSMVSPRISAAASSAVRRPICRKATTVGWGCVLGPPTSFFQSWEGQTVFVAQHEPILKSLDPKQSLVTWRFCPMFFWFTLDNFGMLLRCQGIVERCAILPEQGGFYRAHQPLDF